MERATYHKHGNSNSNSNTNHNSSSIGYCLTEEEVAAALVEAKARGLPDGWTVKLDKRKRRKWIAPNGRSCDSIPKAVAMSIEMGLLPRDTPIPKPAPGRKQSIKKLKPNPSMTSMNNNNSSASALSTATTTNLIATSQSSHSTHVSDKLKSYSSSSLVASKQQQEEQAPDDSGSDEEDEEEDDDDDVISDPGEETDPETTLDVPHHNSKRRSSAATTIAWDPNSLEGRKIGWKIRISHGPGWREGRIVRYDPYSHKHKIAWGATSAADGTTTTTTTTTSSSKHQATSGSVWLRLRMEPIQLATQICWAHVKGYAWWPALIVESNVDADLKDGFCHVEFFGSAEVATLRHSPDCIRPFDPHQDVDAVVAKHKKKRNAKAYSLACQELTTMTRIRNQAARYYARQAYHLANAAAAASHSNHSSASSSSGSGGHATHSFLGKRVQVFRSDVHYPYGDTVIGTVRKYSVASKKWLLSYEVSDQTRQKYPASWINLLAKEHSVKLVVDSHKKKAAAAAAASKSTTTTTTTSSSELNLIPYLRGLVHHDDDEDDDHEEGSDGFLAKAEKERCRGCVDYWRSHDSVKATCCKCHSSYHLGCVDPPLTTESWQRIDRTQWTCPNCIICKGCLQNDIVFGCSVVHPPPPTLSLPEGQVLELCMTCASAYQAKQYCPNCAHVWDDVGYQKWQKRLRWQEQEEKPKGRGRKRKRDVEEELEVVDQPIPSDVLATTTAIAGSGSGRQIDPTWYFSESSNWGYTTGDMLVCDSCSLWVHAGCASLTEEEYDLTSTGKHPIYSKEFLCRVCCKKRSRELIEELQRQDEMHLFAEPVTEKMAPNYGDVIKDPMDLQTMAERAQYDKYLNYAWIREAFELMVLNALTFNRMNSKFWLEAQRFFQTGTVIFEKRGKGAPPSKYHAKVLENMSQAEEAKKMEEERVQQDESTEKKDLVAGSQVVTVTLPKLREAPPDQTSCLPFTELKLKPVDAYFHCWMDCCFTCGSSGAADTMLFCVDCGEAFHSFCVNAPIHSMALSSVSGWRCPNCKICEISGDVPKDELRMLFCEMCDRAFSLDLLDPPLEAAPKGWWVCGQCVDCKMCGNTSEPRGVSLKYWSSDPGLCYRCGGCKGLVENYVEKTSCHLCSRLWRVDDELVRCCDCSATVHVDCDDFAIEVSQASRNQNPKKYRCPSCRKSHIPDVSVGQLRKQLHDQAWLVIIRGSLQPHDNYSHLELHEKLMAEIDWMMRDSWRHVYQKIIEEGIRFFNLIKSSLGDPRVAVNKLATGENDIPLWMRQRALRFLCLLKRRGWATRPVQVSTIQSGVLTAKLAASFVRVACRAMGMKTKSNIQYYDKVMSLLIAPTATGLVDLPLDTVRLEGAEEMIHQESLLISQKASGATENTTETVGNIRPSTEVGQLKSAPKHVEDYKIAAALCGWQNPGGDSLDPMNTWKDPRECCLCHLCGDDDAGFETVQPYDDSAETGNPRIARVGRLLPMWDGLWIHTWCALWSSEVWEDSNDSQIHGVERARSRGAQLKCFGCGRPGATVGCNKGNCSCNYHFPCAKACGAVFTEKQQVYCSNHTATATGVLARESFEFMKALIVAPEKPKASIERDASENAEPSQLCPRVGALVVHSFGSIDQSCDGFHSENYITPLGFVATRIFWSAQSPRTRTLYVLKIERSLGDGRAMFTIVPSDDPSSTIRGHSIFTVYNTLVDRVRKANSQCFSQCNLLSKLPMVRRTRKKTFGLNGPQFFGFGLDHIRKIIEASPGVEAVVTPLTAMSPKYRFCFVQPTVESIMDLQRKRAAAAAEQALENPSGSARTEGMTAVARSGGSNRITRALVRSAEEAVLGTDATGKRADPDKAKVDRNIIQQKYREMKAIPMEQTLVARRSHIHGWGLFTKVDFPKDAMIVEYMGETIRQCIADKREKEYEVSGMGSCYMFRLDKERIVDATMIGCMARFMNHCCQPNAYAKIITVDTDQGPEKKIVVFANRNIDAGEEVTYDYKFPVEDGSLRCTCGAANCIGRMN